MDLGSVKHRDTVQGASAMAHDERQNLIALIALAVAALGLFAAVGGWLYTATRPTPPASAALSMRSHLAQRRRQDLGARFYLSA